MLKRNNWTNSEIIEILRSRLLTKDDDFTTLFRNGNNFAIDGLIDEFESCDYPPEMMGAFAYDTEKKHFVHIGEVPDECKLPIARRNSGKEIDKTA